MHKNLNCKILLIAALCLTAATSAEAASITSISTTTTAVVPSTTIATTLPVLQNPAMIENRIREYFADVPVMIEVARCESKFRQFTDSGSVLRGGSSRGMIGIFQFYEAIHAPAAAARGFDLATVEGNIGYARHLYAQSGTKPWSSCVPDVIPVATTMSIANKELQIKLLTKVVELLTELLKMKLAEK